MVKQLQLAVVIVLSLLTTMIALPLMAQQPNTLTPLYSDSSAEIIQQAAHANPRMRFKQIKSRYVDKASLWQPFTAELDAFGEERYQALKPLVLEKDIASLQRSVASGELSYETLVLFYLYRSRKIELDPDLALNALIALNADAIFEARMRDVQRSRGEVQVADDSLFGMPILLKDNIGSAGLATTAGALVLQDNMAADAFITRRLKAQGAIILGKSNLSEWAYFFCDGCPLGYSAIGGQTLNPYGRKIFESGGSSSGSAVAVAANYAVAAVGTETSGSILSPASLNSSVGLKPTTGSLSRSGIVPISATLDTPGPIARTVADALLLFNAMSGFDPADSAMPMPSADLLLAVADYSLDGRRLGYFATLLDDTMYVQALDRLREAGAELVEVVTERAPLTEFSDFLAAEMRRDLPVYLAQHANSNNVYTQSLATIMAFNQADMENRAPYGQGRFDAMQAMPISEEELAALRLRLQTQARAEFEAAVQALQLDALLSVNNRDAAIAALANYPALTIPMGLRESGEPAGLTLLAPGFAEQLLVNLGLQIERILPARQVPTAYH